MEGRFLQNYITYRPKKWCTIVFGHGESNGNIFNIEKSAGLPVLATVLPLCTCKFFGRHVLPHTELKNGVLVFVEAGNMMDTFLTSRNQQGCQF